MSNDINAAGYELKPWWPYVRELMSNQVTVESVTILENGVYTAPAGKAYSPVTVNVPTYEVDSLSVTENGTYTPETGHAYNSVTVNVPVGAEGFTDITCTAVLNEGVEVLDLSILPYIQSGALTESMNCITYSSVDGGFQTSGAASFTEESLTADFLYMLDYAYFSVETEGVSYDVTGDAEKITIEIGGVSGTVIKASGDFTITASALS